MNKELLRITAADWKDFTLGELAGMIRGLNESPYLTADLELDDDGNPEAVIIAWKRFITKVVSVSELRARMGAKRHMFLKASYSEEDMIDACQNWGLWLEGESKYWWVLTAKNEVI